MAKMLNINSNKYVIIPSVGASNCVNICTILQGWNCKYIAVFDYDEAGVESGGEYMRKNLCSEYKRQYCYLLDASQDDIDNAKLNLINSITELVNIKDLVDVINRANSIIESNVEYTEETIQALKEELNNAKTVLNNEYAAQEEVDNVLKALDDSIKALEKKTVDPSVDKEEPSKPSNPSGDNSDGETVKTGDTQGSKILLFGSLVVIAGLASLYFRKKKIVE